MWDAEKKRIIDRYNERIAREGLQFSALASGTEERREMRFKILTEIGIQSGDSVLDLGCGFGDFSVYLDRRGLDIDYTGYDINPKLIGEAQRRHPQRRFEERDILQESFPDFDYVVSSSCFNLRMIDDDNYDFVRRIMTNSYAHARKGVTIDFLSSYVDYQSVEGFHYQPETIFRFAKALTKRVCIRHDYPLFEFNVYLRREFQGWGAPRMIALTFDVDFTDYVSNPEAPLDELGASFKQIREALATFPQVRTTWFIRMDSHIGATFGSPDYIFRKHENVVDWLRAHGHEVAWHHHAYKQVDGQWKPEFDEARIASQLGATSDLAMEYGLAVCRMGWGFQTNRTMEALERLGWRVDCSAIPRPRYDWDTVPRDWTTTPQQPFFPSIADYRVPGDPERALLEVPTSTVLLSTPTDTQPGIVRYINPAYHPKWFRNALDAAASDSLVLICHPYELLRSKSAHPLLAFSSEAFFLNMETLVERVTRFGTISEMIASDHQSSLTRPK